MSKDDLFPHLGLKVPLNYAALERCMARKLVGERATEATEAVADWEVACAAHHRRMAQEHGDQWVQLEELCSQDVVALAALKEAASKCGIASEQLESALEFLHVSGSLLYYAAHSRVGDGEVLRETVFTHPSWIVDAVKCFIHEPDAEEQND
eukprot:117027-Rhodomonas_salina.1